MTPYHYYYYIMYIVQQGRVFQTAYSDYWSTVINSCADSKTLWRKVTTAASTGPHSANNFADYSLTRLKVSGPQPLMNLRRRYIPGLFRRSMVLKVLPLRKWQRLLIKPVQAVRHRSGDRRGWWRSLSTNLAWQSQPWLVYLLCARLFPSLT